jgi:hypothetical protein
MHLETANLQHWGRACFAEDDGTDPAVLALSTTKSMMTASKLKNAATALRSAMFGKAQKKPAAAARGKTDKIRAQVPSRFV